LVADLERLQLISRKRSARDRRELIIAITAKGRRVLLEDLAARRAWLQIAMSTALTAAERQVILSASGIMLKLAGYQHPAAPQGKVP
jgi:DNA-binding MarR family transcriptional regulator